MSIATEIFRDSGIDSAAMCSLDAGAGLWLQIRGTGGGCRISLWLDSDRVYGQDAAITLTDFTLNEGVASLTMLSLRRPVHFSLGR